MTIYECLKEICKPIFALRINIKLMSDEEFETLLKELDNQQRAFAIYLRCF